MSTVFLALGSNLGNRQKNLEEAFEHLQRIGLTILKKSLIIESKPAGGPKQNDYLNCVIKASTSLDPHQLLQKIKAVETQLGRVKTVINGPRLIDIDILMFDDINIQSKQLTIPHPRMLNRLFVMEPLKEIEPELAESLKCSSIIP